MTMKNVTVTSATAVATPTPWQFPVPDTVWEEFYATIQKPAITKTPKASTTINQAIMP